MKATPLTLREHLAGTLLGTALGDSLGLACEGMSAQAIARRFGTVDRFRLLGSDPGIRVRRHRCRSQVTALVSPRSLSRHPSRLPGGLALNSFAKASG